MATRIQRIHAIWGETDRIAAEPELRILAPAIYRPAAGERTHRVEAVDETSPPEALRRAPEGLYILVDGMTGHYGHFIVDVLSHFWPLANRMPGPVWLVAVPDAGRAYWARHPFLTEMLAGLDLTLDAVVSFADPVLLPQVAIPAPSFRSLHSVHAVFGDLCRTIGRRHWTESEVDTVERPAYLSKSRLPTGIQRLVNEGELVAELEARGVDILFPEAMTFADQVREFAQRRVVLGLTGSAFHTAPFSAPARRTIALSGMLHIHANHILFDAINGNRSYYYFTPGTSECAQDGFGVGWTIPDPRQVAAQMVHRAENIDRIEGYDAAIEAEAERRGQSLIGRLRRALIARRSRD